VSVLLGEATPDPEQLPDLQDVGPAVGQEEHTAFARPIRAARAFPLSLLGWKKLAPSIPRQVRSSGGGPPGEGASCSAEVLAPRPADREDVAWFLDVAE